MGLEYCLLFLGTVLISVISGEKIKVTTIQEEPYVKKEGTKYTGFIPDLMAEIAKKANIEYQFHTVRDGKYGAEERGHWNGMVGEILNGEADLAAAPITISQQREEVIDFSKEFMNFGTTILLKRPEEGEEPPVNSAQELAEQTEIKYGLVKDGETNRFFKSAKADPYKKMWNKMQNNLVNNIPEGIKKVRDSDGKYAFIIESSTADYWVNKEPCDLITVGEKFNRKSYGFALEKNSNLKTKIDRAITDLKNDGRIEELRDKYWNTDNKCNSASTRLITFSTWAISLLIGLLLSR